MNFTVTKEWFVKHMERIVEAYDWIDKIWDAEILDEDFVDTFCAKLQQPITMLQEIMNDEDEDWIGYWLYELECGKRWTPDCAEDEDGEPIALQTIEDLWNVLTKE